ncbi:DUF4321 domain-containing protein [Dendrosporobacter sp. 1207_IL3150]|uniref:DUF4321 domain-containing protein n=1 Tax=Dendrosporobacter sp. 1207_IL3150 TaxID=3084054 RepID=UPI002FDB0877
MPSGKNKGYGLLALFLITGAILGGILGEFITNSTDLAGLAPYLVKNYPIIDLPPVIINLYVIKFIVGFALHPNLMSILGIIAAIFLFRRF